MKMSPITILIIGGVLTLAGGVITTLGLSRLKQAEESISLSVPPSLDLTVAQLNKSAPEIVLSNTGQHSLKDIVIWGIRYDERLGVLATRMAPNMGTPVAALLKPKQQASIRSDKVLGPPFAPRTDKEVMEERLNRYAVFVVVYRREADNQRFVDIEVASIENINGNLAIFHYLNSASGGKPQHFLKIMKEMIENEKFIFKAK